MKNNTYIIPAIKFYIAIPLNKGDEFSSLDNVKQKLSNNECQLIPFDQVDGLTIEEIITLDGFSKGFAVCAINKMEAKAKTYTNITSNVLNILFFPKKLDCATNKTIDKVVEEEFELKYNEADPQTRRIYNSFFETYQDNSYEDTKERIKKLSGVKDRK